MLFGRSETVNKVQSCSLQCHFCLQTTVFPSSDSVPPRPKSSPSRVVQLAPSTGYHQAGFKWICERCGCWNGWDENGETLSFHSQMQDPSLNTSSFQKRATYPSTTLPLPALSSKSPFCSSCTTNHMIVINLLANYLPEETDPGYVDLLSALPAYEKRLYERYPPVCDRCEPIAEEEIRKGDYRAKTSALNGFLVNTSTVPPLRTSRHSPSSSATAEAPTPFNLNRSGGPSFAIKMIWELKRILWLTSAGVNLVISSAFISPTIRQAIQLRAVVPVDLPSFKVSAGAVLSILWIAWDPIWKDLVKAQSIVGPTGLTPGGRLRRKRWVETMLGLYPIRIISGIIVDIATKETGDVRPTERAVQIAKCWMGFHLVVELLVLSFFIYMVNVPPVLPPRPIHLTRTEPSSGSLRKHQRSDSSDSNTNPKFSIDPKIQSTLGPISGGSSSVDVFGRPHHPLFGSGSFPAWPASAASFGGPGARAGAGTDPFSSSSHKANEWTDIDGGLMDWQPTSSPSHPDKGTSMDVDRVKGDEKEKSKKKKRSKRQGRGSVFVLKKSAFDSTPSDGGALKGSDGEISDDEDEGEEDDEEEDTTWLGFNRAPRVFPSPSRRENPGGSGTVSDAAGGLERLFEGWSIGEEHMPARTTRNESYGRSDEPRPEGLGRLVRSLFGRG